MRNQPSNQSLSPLAGRAFHFDDSRGCGRSSEEGWALLGLLLALSVMSIFLVSSVAPNVKIKIQREKEDEMVYRGNQIAKAIARYYGNGNPQPIQILVPPPYGFLTDLKKLRDGVSIGVREIKFVRASEMIDPMTGIEWAPVRARDPRIMKFLQAYSAETNSIIPQSYFLLAGPPQKPHSIFSTTPSTSTPQGQSPPGQVKPKPPPSDVLDDTEEGDDDDDDEDDEANDPLRHLFGTSEPGSTNIPIIGVAPKLKGKAVRPLYGLDKYEEWVFIYIPPFTQIRPGQLPVQPQNPNPNNPQRISP